MTASADAHRRGLASFADRAFAAAADAYARTPASWESAVHAGIASLFEFLADRPAETTSCIVADGEASRTALAARDRLIARFSRFLDPGFERASTRPPAVVAEAIGGGVYELVRSHVLEWRLDELPAAVPSATVLALSPFVGARAAVEVANSASPR